MSNYILGSGNHRKSRIHLRRGKVEEHEGPAVDVVVDHELGEVGAILQIVYSGF